MKRHYIRLENPIWTILFWNLLWLLIRCNKSMEKSVFSREYDLMRKMLRQTREQAEITQIELAERLGETQSFVSKCERGERRLDLVQLRAFCKVLGVSLPTFVGEFDRRLGKRG